MTNIQSALNARAQISLLASGFIHSHRKRTRFLSARLSCVRSRNIFSPEFNKSNLECGYQVERVQKYSTQVKVPLH